MDTDELIARLSPLLKRHLLPIALATLGLICLGYGLISLKQPKKPNDIIFEKADTGEVKEAKVQQIVIDIQGAVELPGVYTLPQDSRVKDAVILAGGLSAEVNQSFVAKSLNLAAKVEDSMKIYIPFKDEEGVAPQSSSQQSGSTTGTTNINSASESQLDTLPGIGKVTAEKIINGRPYDNIDELLTKKVVSKSVFEKIKEKIRL